MAAREFAVPARGGKPAPTAGRGLEAGRGTVMDGPATRDDAPRMPSANAMYDFVSAANEPRRLPSTPEISRLAPAPDSDDFQGTEDDFAFSLLGASVEHVPPAMASDVEGSGARVFPCPGDPKLVEIRFRERDGTEGEERKACRFPRSFGPDIASRALAIRPFRDADREAGAARWRVSYPEVPAMIADHRPRDVEPEAISLDRGSGGTRGFRDA